MQVGIRPCVGRQNLRESHDPVGWRVARDLGRSVSLRVLFARGLVGGRSDQVSAIKLVLVGAQLQIIDELAQIDEGL